LIALVAVGLWWGSGAPLSVDRALSDAVAAHDSVSAKVPGDWQAMASAPATHPFPGASIRVPPTGWTPISGLGDRAAVAYRLGPQASVFVFRPRGEVGPMPAGPPAKPRNPAGSGVNFGVWSANGLVYVLRVEGSEIDYRRALTRTPSPLASLIRPQTLRDRYHG
jgi:hypothetical protein